MKNTAQKIDLLRPVFDKLNLVGFDDDYISNYGLPSWWDEELNFTVSGAMEGIAIIADRFNIKLESLLYEDKIIQFNINKSIGNWKRSVENSE
jgi:hypothetical protein